MPDIDKHADPRSQMKALYIDHLQSMECPPEVADIIFEAGMQAHERLATARQTELSALIAQPDKAIALHSMKLFFTLERQHVATHEQAFTAATKGKSE